MLNDSCMTNKIQYETWFMKQRKDDATEEEQKNSNKFLLDWKDLAWALLTA